MPVTNPYLYNYISQHSKPLRWVMYILFFSITVLLAVFYRHIFNDQNVSFYTFSTIVQGFLALIGFLGTVVIFKLQLIEGDAEKVIDVLKPYVTEYRGVQAHGYSWAEMMNECGYIIQDQKGIVAPDHYLEHIKIGHKKLQELSDQKSLIRNAMVDFSMISLLNVVIALLGIPLSKFLIIHELLLITSLYLLINIIISFFSALMAFTLIRTCLGYSFKIKI